MQHVTLPTLLVTVRPHGALSVLPSHALPAPPHAIPRVLAVILVAGVTAGVEERSHGTTVRGWLTPPRLIIRTEGRVKLIDWSITI